MFHYLDMILRISEIAGYPRYPDKLISYMLYREILAKLDALSGESFIHSFFLPLSPAPSPATGSLGTYLYIFDIRWLYFAPGTGRVRCHIYLSPTIPMAVLFRIWFERC